ncbi:thaumatin-like protein 1b [Punica granatum]|uniref:Uncharacterized protein n=2 Tax=Punica granatum TaxID=22663 RepID=A0A218X1D1_PUNGR|nr:thaumatin-like protein 1b [Punica granatum]OWM78546.1 hypothetical protein CDL15_Pgr016270 [Punica granatum]PKI68832.1 hypothetical protein CRG98_010889 [Punica granatum]
MERRSSVLLLGLLLPFFLATNHCIDAATFTIKNNCPYTVWPATLTGSGSQLSTTGFELASGASNAIDVPNPWSGRVWGRTSCSTDGSGRFTCQTGDCGSGVVACNGAGGVPPASLAELTLVAGGGQDTYDISLVDGFNIPISITPQGGSGGCSSTSCPANVNSVCPAELSVKGTDGNVIACKSACVAFNEPQYCCTGQFASPQTCPPTSYSMIFKNQCPQAYSYAYDDSTSTFTCSGGANYLVTFCP